MTARVDEFKLLSLTPKQRECWDMAEAGKLYRDIAAHQGCSVPVVSKRLVAIRKKLGLAKVGIGERRSAENRDPAATAAVIDAASEPLEKLRDALDSSGLPNRVSEAVVRRIKTRFFGAITAAKNLKTQEILDMLGKKIHLGLSYMDDKVMEEASFRDLSLGITAMIEKRQLLRGEPTQIISDAERRQMHELLPALMAEAERRGVTLPGQVTEKTVEPA